MQRKLRLQVPKILNVVTANCDYGPYLKNLDPDITANSDKDKS